MKKPQLMLDLTVLEQLRRAEMTIEEVRTCLPPVLDALLQPAQEDGGGNVPKHVDDYHLQRHRKRPQPRRDRPQHHRRVGRLQLFCNFSKYSLALHGDMIMTLTWVGRVHLQPAVVVITA